MNKEEFVWIPQHPEFEWYPGRVISRTITSITAVDSHSVEFVIPIESAVFVKEAMLEPVEDLLRLNDFSEALLLHTIRNRYFGDQIYTAIGISITLAVNPYKTLPLYSKEIKSVYSQSNPDELHATSPHLYRTAELVRQNMQHSEKGQSILITGESGAGKTESTKIILNYLTSQSNETGVEEKILFTNPVLEAFGNAQTVRNDNSSRFGKYIELFFDGGVQGARIESYLLEKSRIVTQSVNERNYHIFYQLYHGGDSSLLKELDLGLTDSYEYLNFDYGNALAKYENDKREFKETLTSMRGIGFDESTIRYCLEILAGILHLGNILIEGDSETSYISQDCRHSNICSKLFGVSRDQLQGLVCTKSFLDPASKQLIARDVSRNTALASKDTLAKTIYNEVFSWLVEGLNSHLFSSEAKAIKRSHVIGILDIFGFEIFDDNSFEQLCINYANEKLQAHFNDHIFTYEQKLYEQEGIGWQSVDFHDNKKIISLLEDVPHSIFSFLDEECMYASSTDQVFLDKIRHKLVKNDHFIPLKPKLKKEVFGIKHFAGEVFYTVQNFLDKNRNSANRELADILSKSTNKVLESIFQQKIKLESQQSKQVPSISKQFSGQLNSLLSKLNESYLLYIRCIKPNSLKSPGKFESRIVMGQLKAAGILQVVKIRKSGFLFRCEYDQFVNDYHSLLKLCPESGKNSKQFLNLLYEILLVKLFDIAKSNFKVQAGEVKLGKLTLTSQEVSRLAKMIPAPLVGISFDNLVKFGKTKIFSKEVIKQIMDILYEKGINRYVIRIQRAYRRHIVFIRRRDIKLFIASVKQRLIIRRFFRNEVASIDIKRKAARRLEKAFLFYRQKKQLLINIKNLGEEWRNQRREAKISELEEARAQAQKAQELVARVEKDLKELMNNKTQSKIVQETLINESLHVLNNDAKEKNKVLMRENSNKNTLVFEIFEGEYENPATKVQNSLKEAVASEVQINQNHDEEGPDLQELSAKIIEEGEKRPPKITFGSALHQPLHLFSDEDDNKNPRSLSIHRIEYHKLNTFQKLEKGIESTITSMKLTRSNQRYISPTFQLITNPAVNKLYVSEINQGSNGNLANALPEQQDDTQAKINELEKLVIFLRTELALYENQPPETLPETDDPLNRRHSLNLLSRTLRLVKHVTVNMSIQIDKMKLQIDSHAIPSHQSNIEFSNESAESSLDYILQIKEAISALDLHAKDLFSIANFLTKQLIINMSRVFSTEIEAMNEHDVIGYYSDMEMVTNKKQQLYEGIFDEMMNLLKQKTLECKLRMTLAQTKDKERIEILNEQILQVVKESKQLRSRLEDRIEQLHALAHVEFGLNEKLA